MPPSGPDRLFFLHILKTGGTSFYRFLENNYARDESIRDDRFAELHDLKADRNAFLARLASLRLITKLHVDFSYVAELRERDPSLRVVTLLRRPVERCFSMIEHWRRVPEVHMASLDSVRRELVRDARTMPAADFVEKHQQRLSDHQTKMLGGVADHTANPPRDELLAAARENLAAIDYVGLTERMTEMAACLSSAMGFCNSLSSQRLNVTRDERRLSATETEQIRPHLAALNQADAALYAEGEERFWQLLAAWKQGVFRGSSAAPPQPLAVGEALHFSMDDPLVGTGWHEREGGPTQSCRWGGPERLSSLCLPCAAAGDLTISLSIVSVISDEVLKGIKVLVNNIAVAHQLAQHPAGVRVTATAELPAGSDQPLCVSLCFPSARSAFEVAGLDDHRRKTVAVETVDVRRTR